MNKKQLGILSSALIALVLMGAGCSSSEPKQYEKQKPEEKTEITVTPAPVVDSATAKEFVVTAKDWKFDPGTIKVKKGDLVRLKITSADVKHSFMLKDYNLNVPLEPNQTQTIEFVADKAGTFSFRCGVPCGEGHRDMTGIFIVE